MEQSSPFHLQLMKCIAYMRSVTRGGQWRVVRGRVMCVIDTASRWVDRVRSVGDYYWCWVRKYIYIHTQVGGCLIYIKLFYSNTSHLVVGSHTLHHTSEQQPARFSSIYIQHQDEHRHQKQQSSIWKKQYKFPTESGFVQLFCLIIPERNVFIVVL